MQVRVCMMMAGEKDEATSSVTGGKIGSRDRTILNFHS